MKTRNKTIWTILFSAVLLAGTASTNADTASDTETLLNWAENTYPELFPNPQGTQTADPWIFRFYPTTGIYAGVNTGDLGVYVLGGPWTEPTYIDSLANIVSTIEGAGGSSSIAACDTTSIPQGLSYSQSGNVVTVTTNGQCITIPENSNICEVPEEKASVTGISVISSTSVTSSSYTGITINVPSDLINLDTLLSGNSSVCTINAPADFSNITVNSDICVDVTNQLGALGDLGSFVSINPPVTFSSSSTLTNQVVADCFATEAAIIVDAVTDQTWINQNGTFVEM